MLICIVTGGGTYHCVSVTGIRGAWSPEGVVYLSLSKCSATQCHVSITGHRGKA